MRRNAPIAKGTRYITITQLPPKYGGPSLSALTSPSLRTGIRSCTRIPAINNGQSLILPIHIHTYTECAATVLGLHWKLTSVCHRPELTTRDQIEGSLVTGRLGERPRRDVGWKSLQGLEDDILVWRPCVWPIPLLTCLNQGNRYSAIVLVHDHVNTREETKCLLPRFVREDFWWNDACPEGVERGGRPYGVACVGGTIEIVESELVGIPEEVEDG